MDKKVIASLIFGILIGFFASNLYGSGNDSSIEERLATACRELSETREQLQSSHKLVEQLRNEQQRDSERIESSIDKLGEQQRDYQSIREFTSQGQSINRDSQSIINRYLQGTKEQE